MSIDAINWAWKIQGVSASEKLILLAYADRANECHESYPSWQRLILDTCLTRKTIAKVLVSLQDKGLLIKTGERKRQVYIYRLMGVIDREKNPNQKKLSTTSSKNATSGKITTSSKNATSTSGKITTSTSGKITTRNPKKNPQRNPQEKIINFSSFSSLNDFLKHIKTMVIETGENDVEELSEQISFYADKFKEKRDQVESLNIAISLIKKRAWKIPHGYKGITSKSIKEKEESYQAEKQKQIQEDAKIGKIIQEAVKTGNKITLAERLQQLRQETDANQGRMQAIT